MGYDLGAHADRLRAERAPSHIERQRPRCTTDQQRAEFDRLAALNVTPWPRNRRGAGVIAEARRYFTSRDAAKIGAGLYEFSIMGSGGFNDIAHFNLNGYRAEYPHPFLYVHNVVGEEVRRWPMAFRLDPDGYHSQAVYTDGLSGGKVAHAIAELANEMYDELRDDFSRGVRARKFDELQRLADELGIAIQFPLRRTA